LQSDRSAGPAPQATADIFLSYKSEDRAAVEPLVRVLEQEGFSVWWDRALVPGEQFGNVIRGALDGCSCVVVAWSKLSVDSHWVKDEASVGRERHKLVPVSLDGSSPPLGFGQVHTVVLSDWNGQADDPRIQRLMAGIRRLVGHPGSNTGRAATAAPAAAAKKKSSRPGTRWIVAAGLAAAVVAGIGAYIAIPHLRSLLTSPARPVPVDRAVERAFPDCPTGCPMMIVVPTGSFNMGSEDGEPNRGNDEGPVRKVTIRKIFLAAKYPVTFEEWDYCHAHGGCAGLLPSDNNWGHGRQPVINVSWQDAQSYIEWLSKYTGHKYRLLTEAEREYIARAGTTTPFWWGEGITTAEANYDGRKRYGDEPAGLFRQRTLTVDTFPPNPLGFYQTSGNTWDWVEDCYHDSYEQAPTDSSAWLTGDCAHRVLRGGSWGSQPRNVRSAARWKQPIDTREPYYGFRVARECDSSCNL
jgi:formylglycine-generating enzyme required for sulfatase activity